MTRNELAALRDAIDTVLTWPPAVLAEVARWLTPAAPQPGNGLDPHPPPIELRSGESAAIPSVAALSKRPGKARPAKPSPAKAAEQRLLTAMRENPGLSVNALANAAGSSRSATGERLRRLASRGTCREGQRRSLAAQGGGDGVGPYAGAPVDLTAAPEADRSDAPPLAAPSRWVRALACYERKEPHEFQMSRYG